jgi:peptidylprolyl isomerase
MAAVLKRVGLILLVCAGLVVAGCGDDSDDSTAGGDSTATTTEATEAATTEESLEAKPKVVPPKGPPPKHLVKKELIPGTGAEAKAGDKVTVQYVGVGYKSGTEFDSSWSRNEPLLFPLGKGKVIKGWDQGVEGMKVGGRRELIIPPNLAYGSAGSGIIAPNATLVFVIDLLAVK